MHPHVGVNNEYDMPRSKFLHILLKFSGCHPSINPADKEMIILTQKTVKALMQKRFKI